jgi:hypothetical protein
MFFPPNSSMMYKTSQVVKYKTLKFEPCQTLKINALEHDENALEYDAQCLVACNAGEILGRYTWQIYLGDILTIEESILFYIFR